MTWLITITRNLAIDRLRARKPVAQDIDEVMDLSSDGPTPEAEVIIRSERAQIDECIGALKADHGTAIRGAYLEGYSYQELADQVGVPINTMRTWLRRSLVKLKECLSR